MTIEEPKNMPAGEDTLPDAQSGGMTRIPDLKPFADQLMLIAQHLREGDFEPAQSTRSPAGKRKTSSDEKPDRQAFAEMARKTYAVRRKRAVIFGNPELFGEPAWDILLDLYVAFVEDKPVSVSSACIGSAAPPTTGLRWLGILADQGLMVREQDPKDQRRILVRLTELGVEAMDKYFMSILER